MGQVRNGEMFYGRYGAVIWVWFWLGGVRHGMLRCGAVWCGKLWQISSGLVRRVRFDTFW